MACVISVTVSRPTVLLFSSLLLSPISPPIGTSRPKLGLCTSILALYYREVRAAVPLAVNDEINGGIL